MFFRCTRMLAWCLFAVGSTGCADLVGADFDGLRMREPGPPGTGGTSTIHEGGADGPIGGASTLPSQRIVSDTGELDFLGVSVAVQGDLALIGARDPQWEGRVLVARAVKGSWALTGEQLDAGEHRAPDARFGASVALSGEWAVVGAPGNEAATRPGEAYFFRRVLDQFVLVERVLASSPLNDDWFGGRVAIDGDVAVVGAPGNLIDVSRGGPGAAHVFRRHGGNSFTRAEILQATGGGTTRDGFGSAVALRGSALAIGAPLRGDRGIASGAVFIAEEVAGRFGILQVLVPTSDEPVADRFGEGTIGIGAEVLLVPSWGAHVQGFARPADVLWSQDDLRPPPGHQLEAGFGWRTAIHYDRALVCARYGKEGRGSVLLYRRAIGAWQYERELWPEAFAPLVAGVETPTPLFGWSVAFDGTTAVISSLFEGDYRGAVYFFQLAP